MQTDVFKQKIHQAERYLAGADPVLAPLIATHGPCPLEPHRNYYEALVGEIIGQQLSTKAAASIRKRFIAIFDNTFPSPEAILTKDVEELRSVGLSRPKATYIRDLATHILDGKVDFNTFDSLDNDHIIAELTSVKGIGEWTAHMFLMFCMGRLDVLAPGDLGIRSGIRALYDFSELPTPDDVKAIAEKHHWHPYETVACWYVWASKDNAPV
jgi:DNA-3-methyladenine glycosylase II